MDVGGGCTISDKWIPVGISTGMIDVEDNVLNTADRVQLNGCTSKYAIVGKSMECKFALYFGVENVSVMWYLDKETIEKHKVRLVKE